MTGLIKIGIFIPNDAQTLDVATVDVLGVMSKEYLGVMDFLPSHVAGIAPSIQVYYITTPANGAEVKLTSGMVIKSTHLYTDEAVAPGTLDIVIVPGPDPKSEFEEGGLKWLARHAATEGVDILSVCTGAFICAAAGIADGKLFSGPRGLQADLKKNHPAIKLVGDDHRWVRDGNLWSSGEYDCVYLHSGSLANRASGGITNGNDLMAAYAKRSKRWPQPVVEIGLMLTDVEDRGQFYKNGTSAFMLGGAWSIVKAWFVSAWSPKPKAA